MSDRKQPQTQAKTLSQQQKKPSKQHRILKWIRGTLGVLLWLVVMGIAILYIVSNRRLTKSYTITPASVVIPNNPATLDEGERLAQVRGCSDCHGADLAGGTVLDDPAIGRIYASNLTSGEGGVGADYSAQDWVTAIRHGVKITGKPARFMPSIEYYTMNDADIGALVAYIQSVPPVNNEPGETSIGPVGRMLWLTGQMPIMVSAEIIPHDAERPETVEVGATVAYGNYLAQSCIGCHTPSFKGGPLPGAAPDAPQASDLTSAGNIGTWSAEEFTTVLRTGVRPDGSDLDPSMPWAATKVMTDVELEALYLFFQSLE